MGKKHTVVGLGEVLWDLLPGGKQLGGAPANFAYFANVLGDRGVVASRIGHDQLGEEACDRLRQLGSSLDYLQRDRLHPTGTVRVRVDVAGQPQFEIIEAVAWDFLEWTPQWEQLAATADAVCFGSLAQRSAMSRSTILRFLRATRPGTLRVFDLNLRQQFYSAEILATSLQLAEIVKLNHEELPLLARLLQIRIAKPDNNDAGSERTAAEALLQHSGAGLVCVTRGCRGSLLVSRDGAAEHPGFPVRVADTVGAGDAFTATLAHYYLRGASLDEMNQAANRVGAWVASQVGATPVPGPGDLDATLAAISKH